MFGGLVSPRGFDNTNRINNTNKKGIFFGDCGGNINNNNNIQHMKLRANNVV